MKETVVKIKGKHFFGFLLICGIVTQVLLYKEKKLLIGDYKVAYGWIQNFGYSAGGAQVSGTYTFNVNGQKYKGNLSQSDFCNWFYKLSSSDRGRIKKQVYPIVYYSGNPEINEIILRKDDYVKYGVPYPDSLSSFFDKYFNCN